MYKINKGIDRPPEVLGIRGMNYIKLLGAGVVAGLMVTMLVIAITGLPSTLCFCFYLVMCFVLYTVLGSYSKKYGERGLAKFNAQRLVPNLIISRSSKPYRELLGKKSI